MKLKAILIGALLTLLSSNAFAVITTYACPNGSGANKKLKCYFGHTAFDYGKAWLVEYACPFGNTPPAPNPPTYAYEHLLLGTEHNAPHAWDLISQSIGCQEGNFYWFAWSRTTWYSGQPGYPYTTIIDNRQYNNLGCEQ